MFYVNKVTNAFKVTQKRIKEEGHFQHQHALCTHISWTRGNGEARQGENMDGQMVEWRGRKTRANNKGCRGRGGGGAE